MCGRRRRLGPPAAPRRAAALRGREEGPGRRGVCEGGSPVPSPQLPPHAALAGRRAGVQPRGGKSRPETAGAAPYRRSALQSRGARQGMEAAQQRGPRCAPRIVCPRAPSSVPANLLRPVGRAAACAARAARPSEVFYAEVSFRDFSPRAMISQASFSPRLVMTDRGFGSV